MNGLARKRRTSRAVIAVAEMATSAANLEAGRARAPKRSDSSPRLGALRTADSTIISTALGDVIIAGGEALERRGWN